MVIISEAKMWLIDKEGAPTNILPSMQQNVFLAIMEMGFRNGDNTVRIEPFHY